eukprot:2470021-Rhodomonas_salina.2
MFSPMTQITGVTKLDMDSRGIPFDQAMCEVRKYLGPDVRLIGQAIQGDIAWLGLKEGQDFMETMDIAEQFRYLWQVLQPEVLQI